MFPDFPGKTARLSWRYPNYGVFPIWGVMISNFVGKDIRTVGKKMGIRRWEFQSQSENLGEASWDHDLFLV